MESNTNLKLTYLTEAVTNLDPDHPATQSHIATVGMVVHKQLSNFALNNPRNKKAKMLLMAIQGLTASSD